MGLLRIAQDYANKSCKEILRSRIVKYFGDETNFNENIVYEKISPESIAQKERELEKIRKDLEFIGRVRKVNDLMG